MLDSETIVRLYENVLNNDMLKYNLSIESIRAGIESMAHVYKADTVSLNSQRSMIADYSDAAHRCAYLHKYAAFHTAMVRDMLHEAVVTNFNFFYQLIFSSDVFRICSLGGGPGSDIIGVLAALHARFSYFDASATVIDYMVDWSFSFDSILRELGTGWYGAFGNNTSFYLNWQYVGANLLKTFKPDVTEALSTASLVTMIKFASAAACQDTSTMIKKIFAAMKPGAALLFIDNDGGGFQKLMTDAADEFNFISIFGPHRHENYINDIMRIKRFGYVSCFKTTVTVHVLQKPFPVEPFFNFSNVCNTPYFENQNRRVILGTPFFSEGSSFHLSPPTPMLYRVPTDLPQNEFAHVPTDLPQNEFAHVPTDLPQNEFAHVPTDLPQNEFAHVPYDFTRDEFIDNRYEFSSPYHEIPQSPCNFIPSHVATPLTNNIVNSPLSVENMRPPIYTPDTNSRSKRRSKKRAQGCLPFRFKTLRHQLSRKVGHVKAQARSLFQKRIKSKKAHPIFRL